MYHLSLLMPIVICTEILKAFNKKAFVNKVEILPLGTVFECYRTFCYLSF